MATECNDPCSLSESGLRSLLALREATFFVPSYQRGYRWTEKHVNALLDDFTKFVEKVESDKDPQAIYFLQPIVVKKNNSEGYWELIDGQQRLTTLYLINAVLCKRLSIEDGLLFKMEYEARRNSKKFLEYLEKYYSENDNFDKFIEEFVNQPEDEDSSENNNIDYYYMFEACKAIYTHYKKLKKDKGENFISKVYSNFAEKIHVLWYNIDANQDNSSAVNVFTRLNKGRIPLTSAELCRALLLNPANHNVSREVPANASDEQKKALIERRQVILGSRWDDMERELHHPDFWGFLGGRVSDNRATRIGFLLDLYTGKSDGELNEHFAFDALSDKITYEPRSGNDLPTDKSNVVDAQTIWDEITFNYQMLRSWYDDHNYYHWIGYLNNQEGSSKIQELLSLAKNSTKSAFEDSVFEMIRKTVSQDGTFPDLENLGYDKDTDKVHKLLFLFNVEYARQSTTFDTDPKAKHSTTAGRFPFGEHSKHAWSLEHVYPQHPEELESEDWKGWVEDHKKILENLSINSLPGVQDSDKKELETTKTLWEKCHESTNSNELQDGIFNFIQNLPDSAQENDTHSLFNLALLDRNKNSSLNNSIFVVKCQKIRKMRDERTYIPIATEALFMRRFSDESMHIPYWSKTDREGYKKALIVTLKKDIWKK